MEPHQSAARRGGVGTAHSAAEDRSKRKRLCARHHSPKWAKKASLFLIADGHGAIGATAGV